MTRVAIQGVNGSYSEEAARAMFGDAASIVECRTFEDTFSAVRLGDADSALVPVENKIVGEIRQSLDLLTLGRFQVLETLALKVQHVLVGTPEATVEDLVSVRSHVEALKQCRKFLAAHPNLTQIVGADTASSVRRIVEEGNAANAAIGSRRAAALYGAKILRENRSEEHTSELQSPC